ncbi:hypothetical protein U2F10_02875 [Leptothoe sp. EHU-05/26/07-4]
MITSLDFLTVCFPDDFQGDSRTVLAVSLWPGMTYGELKDEIECTSNAADYGIDDWTGWETALDDFFESANPNSLLSDVKDFEFSDNHAPYAYFAINQQTAPLLEAQLQLLDEIVTHDMRVCCVDAEKLVDVGALELPDLDENEWAEHIPTEAYDSEGDYISYRDLEIRDNPNLNRCYSHQIPVLELVGYSDYSGSLRDQSNYEVFKDFLIENNLPYWQANGGHGTVALIVNWVALQNEELVEMIASLDGYPILDEDHWLTLESEAFDDQIQHYSHDLERGFEKWFEIEDLDEYVEKFYPLAYERGGYATEIFIDFDCEYNGGNPYHHFETGGQMYLDTKRFFNEIDKETFDAILHEINEEEREIQAEKSQLKLEIS